MLRWAWPSVRLLLEDEFSSLEGLRDGEGALVAETDPGAERGPAMRDVGAGGDAPADMDKPRPCME